MSLPALSIRRPILVLTLLASILALGTIAAFRLPVGFLPDVEEPHLFVRVPYPNSTPDQIERTIVRPLEETLGSVKGLRSMWSMCDADGGIVQLGFDWSRDMDLARVEVHEKVDRLKRDLPDDIGDVTVSSGWDARSNAETVMEARLASGHDLSKSYELLERKFKKPLERVPGVASVALDGVNPPEVRVNLRLHDLERHRVDVRRVASMLQSSNFEQSLGVLRGDEHRFALRTVGTFHSIQEIAALPLDDRGLRLGDVADVTYAEPPLEYGRHLDGQFAIGISINKEGGANTVAICDEVISRVDAMKDDPELEGINFLVWDNQGKEIRRTMHDLRDTGIIGAILAALVLFLFLRRFSTTIVAVFCIPFSLIATCAVIFLLGKSLNTLSLLGLIVGIGMLVDNAVVMMENIFRHQSRGLPAREAARRGSTEVALAITAATSTSVIVFLPLIFNKPSEMNIYLKELGLTVCFTLLASLLVTQTLIPVATARLIRAKAMPPGRVMRATERVYARVLQFFLRHRWLTPVVGLAITASAVWPFLKIDKNFDTNQSEMFVQVGYNLSEEQSLDRKEELVTQVEAALEPLRKELDLRSIYSFWSDGWTMTRLYPKEGRANEAELARIRARLRQSLPEVAGVRLEVHENGQFWRPDRSKRIAFQITGEDSEVLSHISKEARDRLDAIPGMLDTFASNQEGTQEVHVSLDRGLVHRYGIGPDQPGQVVGLTFRGRRLRKFRGANGEVEMRLTLDERDGESLAQLQHLPLRLANGTTIPLASVASFRVVPGAERIQRDERLTSVWVGGRYEEGTRQEWTKKIDAAMQGLEMPFGYAWSFGQFERHRKESAAEFLTNLVLALLLVFAVMASIFESIRQAVALAVALPFAIAGAAWTLYATGCDFDQPAAVGLLLLIGIVVNNGIVMIEHVNGYRRSGMARAEALLLGGSERLRPILMTALTTLLSLVPIVVQKPTLAGVYYYSMALVIMGGLAVSTFLTLVLLPTTVTLVEDAPARISAAARWVAAWTQAGMRRLAGRTRRSPAPTIAES
jgi:HAE1 family hydrophobic/amphiphilic exporter-1